jgi:multidrug resistance efflux pump
VRIALTHADRTRCFYREDKENTRAVTSLLALAHSSFLLVRSGMSIGTSAKNDMPPEGEFGAAHGHSAGQNRRVDAGLVQSARDEIHQLTRRIRELSSSDLEPPEFFSEFLRLVASALASVGGAVWMCEAGAAPQLISQVNLADERLRVAMQSPGHRLLLKRAATSEQSWMIPPGSDAAGIQQANPSDCLLMVMPLIVSRRVVGMVEIFQRGGRGAAAERGFHRFLEQTCAAASDFLTHRQLRQLSQQVQWVKELDEFLRDIHAQLDIQRTASVVANEIRRLLDCDRVSIALGRGRRCRVVMVSGIDRIDRRTAQLRHLERLAGHATILGDPLQLPEATELSTPQIESQWNHYVDESHVRYCQILPLFPPPADDENFEERPAFGAVIIERFSDANPSDARPVSAEQLTRHGERALHNAITHNNVFLLPLWQFLGRMLAAIGGQHFPKTLLLTVLLVAIGLAMTTIQTPFRLPVRGRLLPKSQQTVFAKQEGVILDVAVDHGELVTPGQLLIQMRNTDLEMEIASLTGQQTTTREQITSIQRTLLENPRLSIEQQNELSGRLRQLQQVAINTQEQLELVVRKQQQLALRAEHAGRVITWRVKDLLLHRPVQKGQALLAIVDPDSEWELELYVPERQIRYVAQPPGATAANEAVSFMLSSHPGTTFEGTLSEIDRTAAQWQGQQKSVRVCVSVEKQQLPELLSDATVLAKLDCGTRSLGYAWFHDLIDAVRARAAFWLP